MACNCKTIVTNFLGGDVPNPTTFLNCGEADGAHKNPISQNKIQCVAIDNELAVYDEYLIEGTLLNSGTILLLSTEQSQGPQGPQGEQGPQGPQGEPGEDTSILSIRTVRGFSYSLQVVDVGDLIIMDSNTDVFLNVSANASQPIPIGSQILVSRNGSGEVTFTPDGGVTINSAQGFLRLNNQYSVATLVKIDTDVWMLFGDLKA